MAALNPMIMSGNLSAHVASPTQDSPGPVMILGAHPDDACLGAGGLASMLASHGCRVVFITATDGRRGGDPSIRRQEDRESAAMLGVELVSWNLPDCQMPSHAPIDLLGRAIERFSPEIILAHYGDDSHQDHRTLSRAAISAGRRVPSLLHYEGPTSRSFRPSLILDVSSYWKRKLAALEAHRSQMSRGNYREWAETVARFRAWPRFREGRCEAFSIHHADLLSLSATITHRLSRFAASLAGN